MDERAWSVRDALEWTAGYFERNSVPEPRRSAEWLLSAATGLSRVELYAHHDRTLTEPERAGLRASVERRAKGEPLQHVTGEVAFRHVVLHVCPGVFIPRPETEVLVDEALAALPKPGVLPGPGPAVVDLCCGSGAVAVSIAVERPDSRVWATDISSEAVRVARENAERCGVADRVTASQGDLFASLPASLRGAVDAVVANPPYIPTGDLADLPSEVGDHEPVAALDGGPDGLEVARRIADEARAWLRPGGVLVMETDTARTQDAVKELSAWYVSTRSVADLTGRDRVAVGRAVGGEVTP